MNILTHILIGKKVYCFWQVEILANGS